jgi:hypothetical protein
LASHKKGFYSKGPFGIFKSMEESGKINKSALTKMESFCESLIKTGESLRAQIGDFNLGTLLELQLLTVGPQFRGSMNNKYGQVATKKTFSTIKDLLRNYILSSTPTSIV